MGELCFSLQYVPGSGPLTVVVLEILSLELAGESTPRPPQLVPSGKAQGSVVRPATPVTPFPLPRALCEGPAHAEPEEVEDEQDVCPEGHGRPLLQ